MESHPPLISTNQIARGCAVLAAGPVLGVILILLGVCHPLVGPFLSTFRVRNDSGQTIWITPLGMWEGNGMIGPLPLYHHTAYMLRDLRVGKRELLPGASMQFTYDMDDINFRHILVRDATGVIRILDTDKRGTIGRCYGAQHGIYSIPPLRSLKPAPQQLRVCERGEPVEYAPLRINY